MDVPLSNVVLGIVAKDYLSIVFGPGLHLNTF